MKRPMCILAVSWLAGLLLAGCDSSLGTKEVLLCYLFLMILGLNVLKKYPRMLHPYVQREWYPQFTLLLLLLPCLFLGGYHRMEQYMFWQEEQELPWKLLSEEGEVYATVEGTVKEKQCGEYVILELEDCSIIGYYGTKNQSAGNCRIRVEAEGKEWLPETFPGNRIRVFGTFEIFQTAANPGQFDAHDYYTGQGVFADISALRITVVDAEKSITGNGIFLLKKRLKEVLISLYPEEKSGVLAAMILGDKELLPEEIEDLYRKNGISHILAISGLHISMLCMGLFRILRKLTIPLKLSAVLTVGFLLFYVGITGASTSSLRAGIMCFVMLGALLWHRSYDLLSSLSFAAVLVTVIRPGDIYSAGFLLSFGAVLGAALAQEVENALSEARDGKRFWWDIFLFGGMIQCITIPISLWFFYELSTYSIVLNLVVVPLVSCVLGGGLASVLLGVIWPAAALLPAGGTYLLLEFYEWLCSMAQKLPFSFVLLGRPAAWQIVVYYVLFTAVLHVFFSGIKKVNRMEFRLAAGLAVCFGVLLLSGKPQEQMIFLDVSQGDGVLIFTEEGKVILSDCGSSDISKVGKYRLLPVLKQKGIILIDSAVVSHLDSDHMSGIKELLEAMPVFTGELRFASGYDGTIGIKELVLPMVQEKSESYLELEKTALEKNVMVRYLEAGEQLYKEKNLIIECISPKDAEKSENDTSLVLLLQTPEMLVWLMGDAGTEAEEQIMKRLERVNQEIFRDERSVVLKVGHHGSRTSSGKAFIEFIQPDISIISCGYRNSYGHPHNSVLNQFQSVESRVFRTDMQGAVIVEPEQGNGVRVWSWMQKNR